MVQTVSNVTPELEQRIQQGLKPGETITVGTKTFTVRRGQRVFVAQGGGSRRVVVQSGRSTTDIQSGIGIEFRASGGFAFKRQPGAVFTTPEQKKQAGLFFNRPRPGAFTITENTKGLPSQPKPSEVSTPINRAAFESSLFQKQAALSQTTARQQILQDVQRRQQTIGTGQKRRVADVQRKQELSRQIRGAPLTESGRRGLQTKIDVIDQRSTVSGRGDALTAKLLGVPNVFERSSFEKEISGLPVKNVQLTKTRTTFKERVRPKGLDRITEALEKTTLDIERRRFAGEDSLKLQVAGVGVGVSKSLTGTAQFTKQFVTSPIQTTKATAAGLLDLGKEGFFRLKTGRGFPEAGKFLREKPGEAVGFVAAEIFTFKGAGVVLKRGSRVLKAGATRLSPSFTPVVSEGGEKVIKVFSEAKPGSTVDIKLAGGTASTAEPLPRQVAIAGKEVTAVSAARDFFGFFERDKTLKKPIAGEELLSESTKKQLARFDAGKITSSKELAKLDLAIKTETKGAGTLLERSFFADPRGRLRQSRLGLADSQKDATLLDLISGDVTFKSQKPQALFFEGVKVQKFPSGLKSIERKLKSGKALTQTEQAELLKFQLTPSEQFKPVGFLSKESEITLAPGEIVKGAKAGVTLLQGQPVTLFRTKIVRSSPELESLLGKSSRTAKQEARLDNLLRKETGITISSDVSLRPRASLPVLGSRTVADVFKFSKSVSLPKSSRNIASTVLLPSPRGASRTSLSKSVSLFSFSSSIKGSPLTRRASSRPVRISRISRGLPRGFSGGSSISGFSGGSGSISPPDLGFPIDPPLRTPRPPTTKKLPSFDSIIGLTKRKSRKKSRRRTRFQPSVVAKAFNIKGGKVPGVLTGLEVRPVVGKFVR